MLPANKIRSLFRMEIVNLRPINRHVGARPESMDIISRRVVVKHLYFMIDAHIMASIQEMYDAWA